MTATVQERVSRLESSLQRLEERVDRLEGLSATTQAPAPRPRAVPESDGSESPQSVVPGASLEDILAGRIFAWVGGVAIVLAAAFFVLTAVRRGWIDERTRIALAFVGSMLLVAGGVVLHELKGQTQAARALVASGIAAGYLTLVAATQAYDLIAPAPGFVVAGVIALSAMAIAVRWRSPLVAGVGIGGALLAPVVVGSGTSGAALVFMAIALAGAVGVLVWCAWSWLAVMAFVLTVPQLLVWLFPDDLDKPSLGLSLCVLMLFWALYLGAAAGFELRVPTTRIRVSSTILVGLDAALVTGIGWALLDDAGYRSAGTAWILAFAAAHVAIGIASRFPSRVNPTLGDLVIAIGLGLSAIGLALAVNGPVLVAGWSAEAVALGVVSWRQQRPRVLSPALGFLALAISHVLVVEAPPRALFLGVDDLGAAVASIAVVALAAAALAALAGPEHRLGGSKTGAREVIRFRFRSVFVFVAGVAALYLVSVVVVDRWGVDESGDPRQAGQLVLSLLWSGVGLAAVAVGLVRDIRALRYGGLALLVTAVVKVFAYDLAALTSLARVASLLVVGLLLIAGAFFYQRLRLTPAASAGSDWSDG